MKVKIIMALLVLGMTCLSGCKNLEKTGQNHENAVEENKEGKEDEEEVEMQVYRTPTEKEMKILEGCNLSSDYMKEIEEKGMSISVQSFVDTAQIMLDYLEEKYGEKFAVVGGEIPGIISGDYMIFAKAVDGEYAGERFEVYYKVDEDGNGYCEDGYFAIIKSMEVQEYLQDIAVEAGTDIKVIGALEGTVGKEYIKETKIEEIEKLNKNGGVEIYVYGLLRQETSESEFENQVKILEKELSKKGLEVDFLIQRVVSNQTVEAIECWDDVGSVIRDSSATEEKYDLRYYEYIKPNRE